MTLNVTQETRLQATLARFIHDQVLPTSYLMVAQKWFIPLVERIIKHQSSANRSIIVGINGCQGSGKSTTTSLLSALLNDVFNISCVSFSIDDFYLSKQARLTLSRSIHPMLATRGVPGTHDIALLESVLHSLLENQSVDIPAFDKSLDDLKPINKWIHVPQGCKIIILEGWCVGLTAQGSAQLANPVNSLESLEDASGDWRQYVNDVLSVDYARVFSLIDYLVMLKAPSFEQVYAWRCEQEHKLVRTLKQQRPDGELPTGIMSDDQIARFVQFYQRLTQHALTTMPAKCDSLFILDETRSITQCHYR